MESHLDWKGLKLSALLTELSLRLICVDPLIFSSCAFILEMEIFKAIILEDRPLEWSAQ